VARASTIDVVVKGEYNDKDLKRAMSDLQKLQAQSLSMGAKMQAVGKQMQDMGAQVSRVGRSMTVGVTLPIVGVGVAATKLAMDFDDSMTKIVSLVGIGRDEVQSMRKDVLALSGQTAKSPQELAEALFVVTSAGLRGADAMSALELSAKAGAAGLGETNDIARAVAGAMNAYGSSVVDAARATDVIVATARAGNFETSQFSASLGRVLPFAKQAGASLEDMGGAVALLTRTNGDAAQSVTQVQALFRAFVVPTEEAKKALDKVGLSAADMRKAIAEDGLPAALTMLDKKLGGNREQLGRLLGSSEAASAAFQILDADADAIAGTFGVVADSANMTNDAFAVTAETSGFKLRAAFTSMKTSLIEFGEIIAPFVEQFAVKLSSLTQSFQNLSPQVKQMIITFAAIIAVVGPVLLIVGKLIAIFGSLIIGITKVIFVVGKIVAGIKIAISIVSALAAAVKILGMVLLAATGPIGLIVIAIGAIIAALVALYHNNETVRNFIDQAWQTIQRIFHTVMAAIVETITVAWNNLRTATQNFITFVRTAFEAAWNVITALFRATPIGLVITHWNTLRDATKVAFEVIGGIITTFKDGAAAAFNFVQTTVSNVFNGIYSTIANILERVKDVVKGAINFIIRGWNRLSFTLPSVDVPFFGKVGGATIGVPQIPELAAGGLVTGPTLALVGEAGPELVLPLTGRHAQQAGVGASNIYLTVNAGMGTNGAEVGRQIVDALKAYERRNGSVYVAA
jgi:TP901 family phage tail tape measure protein